MELHGKRSPFGFRTSSVIFLEENGDLKAKLKIYGFTIKTKNLIVISKYVKHNQVNPITGENSQ